MTESSLSLPRVGGRARDFNLQSSSFRAIGRRLGIARSTPASPVHERGRTSRLDPRESGRRRTRRAVVSASRRAVHRRRFTARLRREERREAYRGYMQRTSLLIPLPQCASPKHSAGKLDVTHGDSGDTGLLSHDSR